MNNTANSEAKFCPDCGVEILRECPNCGKPLTKNSHVIFQKYCTYCGEMYSWWANVSLTSEQEKELIKTNLETLEILKKLATA